MLAPVEGLQALPGSEVVALIPARGGSKRVPRKNVRLVGGRPLIAWTIDIAQRCPVLDKVIVSTDDGEIAHIAQQLGALVPFLRPPELSTDDARSVDVMLHALDWLEAHGEYPHWLVLLQPTSPLRAPEDVQGAFELARTMDADAVIGVTVWDIPWSHMAFLRDDGTLSLAEDGERLTSSLRGLNVVINGAVYVSKVAALRQYRSLFAGQVYGYVVPRERSLDIDTEWDLHIADLILGSRGRCYDR